MALNNFRYAYDTTLTAESELRHLLMRIKEESEESGLKLNIKKLRSWHLVPSFMANRRGKSGSSFLSWAPTSLRMVTVAMKLEDACFLEGKL